MSRFYMHERDNRVHQAMSFIHRRRREIQERRSEDDAELDFLAWWEKEINPCPGCNGLGEVVNHIDQDTAKFEKCKRCNGTGLKESS